MIRNLIGKFDIIVIFLLLALQSLIGSPFPQRTESTFAVAHRKDVIILAFQAEAFDHQPIVHFLTQKKGLAIRAHDASSIGVQNPTTNKEGSFVATKKKSITDHHGLQHLVIPSCVAQMECIVDTCGTLHAPSVVDPCGRTHRDSTDRCSRTTLIVRQKQSNAQLSSRRRNASHSRPRLICLILRSTFLTITSILETISSGRDLFLVPSR